MRGSSKTAAGFGSRRSNDSIGPRHLALAFAAELTLAILVCPLVALAQADPVISLSKKTSSESVRLGWSVGSTPFEVLRRAKADPAQETDLVLQSGFVLSAYDDVGALADSEPVYFYTVTAASGPDSTAPTISITSPVDGTSISTNTPTVTVTYGDPLALLASSGLDLSSLNIPIDDVEFSNEFTKDTASASFTYSPSAPLSDGLHTILASIRDVVGNKGSATPVSFSVNGPIIQSLSPTSGLVGASIQIIGQGFSATPGNNTVVLDGVPATVTAATTTSLTVTVPIGAVTGAVSVTVNGLKSNEKIFTVEAITGFTRINNIWYNSTGDLVVVDRMADRVYCVPAGTTTKNVLDGATTRPVGLGVTDTQTLFYSASNVTTGPIYTLSNCIPGRTFFRNVQDTQGFSGVSYAAAHRRGIYGGENAVYIAYHETDISTTRLIFRMPDAGLREQTPNTYTFPVNFTVVTGMEFDLASNLFITNGSLIYYIPSGGAAGDVRTITSSFFSQPAGMVFDDRGNLYVACQGNGTIVRVRPSFTGSGGSFDGTVNVIASGYSSGLNGLRALAFQRIAARPVLSVAEATRITYLRLSDIETIQVQFSHGGSGSAVDIRHNGTTDVQTPEWSALSSPRNEPAVLVEGQSLTVKARFRSTSAVTSAKIRATASVAGYDLGEQTVTFTNGDSGLVTFSPAGAIPTAAPNLFGLEYQWKVRDINSGGSSEVNINASGKHPLAIVFATPTFPQDRNNGNSTEPWYDEVIEKAVLYSRGTTSQTDALSAIAKNYYDSHEFNYNSKCGLFAGGYFHLTQFLNGHEVDCVGTAGYFVILARSIGIPSSKVRVRQCGTDRLEPKWTTSDVRLTHRSAAACTTRQFYFHQFAYDPAADSVWEPMFKVGCTAGSQSDGTVPTNMPFVTYNPLLNPSGDYQGIPNPCDGPVAEVGAIE